MSANMKKFKTNRFPTVDLASRKRKKILLKDGRPITHAGVKEKGADAGVSGVVTSSARSSLSARSSGGQAPKKASLQKQMKRIS